ncbi:MAG: FIST C-terminal domain-containing protein [Polyangiaceae bacterium]|nr:FIST C-terminal domain-containing protein [Polyangiaceae bacterium]
MGATAASFEVRSQSPAEVAAEVGRAVSSLGRAAGAVVFVSGSLTEQVPAIGHELGRLALGVPLVVASGAGVVSERGELEAQAAATGIVWSGAPAEGIALRGADAPEVGEALGLALSDRLGSRPAPALLLAHPGTFGPESLHPLDGLQGARGLLGAGTVGRHPPVVVHPGGEPEPAEAALLVLRGVPLPAVAASPACRLLCPLAPVTGLRGSLVTEIGGRPVLEVLGEVGQAVEDESLVLVALGEEPGAGGDERPGLVIRAARGLDPVRGGVLLDDDVRLGLRLAFAVRDSAAARADLESAVRRVVRASAGAHPRFLLYLSCGARGAGLHGQPDVELRILRSKLGEVPIAGLASSFEIAPFEGRPALHFYAGVVALFGAPS